MSKIRYESAGDRVFSWVINIIAFFALIVVLYPLYFVVIASFSNPGMVAGGKVWLYPKGITFMGYQKIFEEQRIWFGYRNTLIYTTAGTAINLFFTIPAAYALSRRDFMLRNVIMFFMVFTMFFSGGLIPTYLVIQKLNMIDTVWVMLIPFCVSVYNVIIARTFFQSNIPKDLLDAAAIDGCTNTRFFFSIVLPLSKAIIAVIGLYYAVGHWNEFFRALIYLKNPRLQPLQIVLRDILINNQAFEQNAASLSGDAQQRLADMIKYGVIIVSTVPILMVYPFIQRYFTKGVMIGAIKG